MPDIRKTIVKFARVFIGLCIGALVLALLGAGVVVGRITWVQWEVDQARPEYREGVRLRDNQLKFVRRELLSLPSPTDIGYAETGDGCHLASGALLLRSERVRRVLTTIDDPLCGEAERDEVLRSIPADRLPTEPSFDTRAFWLERAKERARQDSRDTFAPVINSESAGGPVRVTGGDPWPRGFLINCSPGRREYSLRTLLPNPALGGADYGELANVKYRHGSCLDQRHWPKINALIDLIWSLKVYRDRLSQVDAVLRR